MGRQSKDDLRAENARLRLAIREYLNETDNPAPDFTMRRILRDRLREVLAQSDQSS